MKLAYEIKKEEAVIWRCYDYGTEVELPEQIEGRPVTELAPYAFSAHMEEGALERDIRQGRRIPGFRREESSAGSHRDRTYSGNAAAGPAENRSLRLL